MHVPCFLYSWSSRPWSFIDDDGILQNAGYVLLLFLISLYAGLIKINNNNNNDINENNNNKNKNKNNNN